MTTNDSIDASKGNCPQAPCNNRKRKIEIWPTCSVAKRLWAACIFSRVNGLAMFDQGPYSLFNCM